jgi:hypothetical protein
MATLENRLQRTRDMQGDSWIFRFGNGLTVHTDPFMRSDPSRVLPIGNPQDAILNRLVCFPEIVADKKVFDPFAGSGILGLMALALGAAHVDFLDISPRAQTFQRENAERNGFSTDRYRALLGSIADVQPEAPYDVVLVNPPFVPTPAGIQGTVTSNGGTDGNVLVELLLARLDALLSADGEAYIYLMQLVAGNRPLISEAFARYLPQRTVEFTPTQLEVMPFEYYLTAYLQCFAQHETEIRRWARDLGVLHGKHLGIQQYVVHVQPKRPGPASLIMADNLAEKYCAGIAYPAAANRELALARVMENFIPAAASARL